MSVSTVMLHLEDLQIDKDRILGLVNLPLRKISNIYMYGSRVYGTYSSGSDYDFLVMANSTEAKREVRDSLYNVHVITPDIFCEDLYNHKMQNLECYFAPCFAKIQIVKEIPFELNISKLKKMAISQSFDSWNKGKFKLNQGDIIRGTKSIFHSLRILLFALQIKEHGKIIDYSEANYYWQEINDCDEIKWNFFKDRFLPLKRDLEKMLVEG